MGALGACSSSGDDGDHSSSVDGGGGDGDGQEGDGDQQNPAEKSECMRAVATFCALSCECVEAGGAAGSGCITRNGTPSGSHVSLTWSDAKDCEVAYTKEWCGGSTQAPKSISECKLAVDARTCENGGATRPSACDPAPSESTEVCTSDSECPGSHCAKAQMAVNGNPFDQEAMTTGRCASECRVAGDKKIFCGSECSPGGGSYCLLGWGCTNSECQCVFDTTRPDLTTETCDRKDNDCNGTVDDQPAADASCVRFGTGYICVEGICQPPSN